MSVPSIALPISRRSFENRHSFVFPLSPDDTRLVLSHTSATSRTGSFSDASISSRNQFIFLPGHITDVDLDDQMQALKLLLGWNVSATLSFRFVTVTPNLTHIHLDDLIYGAGRIDILQEIILPNIHCLISLDCILSPSAHVQLTAHLPQSRHVEEIDVEYFTSYTRPTIPLSVRARYTFASGPSANEGTTCRIRNGLPSFDLTLDLRLPWASMKKIDMSSTILLPRSFMHIMGLASNSLVEGYFYVVFDSLPFSTAQLIYPITMHILSRLHLRLVNNPPTFLLSLYIPVLKDIWIEWVDQDHPFAWDLAFYANWLSRSSPSLQKLLLTDLPLYPALSTLTGIDIHSHHTLTRPRPHYDVLEALLMVVPNLRGLALPPGIHVALPILADISNGTLLPNLEFLEIGANTITEQDSIIQMVKFRNQNANSYNFDFDSDSASSSIFEAVSATDLSMCSPIKTLNLIVPQVTDKAQKELRKKVEGLKLAEGYRIQYIPPCEVCGLQCRFSH